MELSRRHFFRRLWSTGDRTPEERQARYAVLESFARTQLLPYDFTLTESQLGVMTAGVRFHLKATRDSELFAPEICVKLQKIVDSMTEPWRQEHFLMLEAELTRASQNREAAIRHIASFLHHSASAKQISALRHRFGVSDLPALEARLETEIHSWINGITNEEVLRYDEDSIQELVFAQLLSWC